MKKRTESLVDALVDGVTAHLTLQARMGLWPAYSEYLLYPPIVAIASHLKWHVHCEYPLPKELGQAGDPRRIDFLFECNKGKSTVVMEVKWPRDPKKTCDVRKDIEKLKAVKPKTRGYPIDARFLLVAGPHEILDLNSVKLRPRINVKGIQSFRARALGIGRRAWGVSVFEV